MQWRGPNKNALKRNQCCFQKIVQRISPSVRKAVWVLNLLNPDLPQSLVPSLSSAGTSAAKENGTFLMYPTADLLIKCLCSSDKCYSALLSRMFSQSYFLVLMYQGQGDGFKFSCLSSGFKSPPPCLLLAWTQLLLNSPSSVFPCWEGKCHSHPTTLSPKFPGSLSSRGRLLKALTLLLDSCHYLSLKVIAKLNKRKAVFSCRCTKAVLTSLIQFAEGWEN